MDVCQDMLVFPVSKGAESGNAGSIGVGIGIFTDIIAVGLAAAQKQDIQGMLLEVNPLRPVLNNMKPSGGGGTVLGEQHFGMIGKPG